jgi:hypothetical protein
MLIKKTTYNIIRGPRMVIAAAFLASTKKAFSLACLSTLLTTAGVQVQFPFADASQSVNFTVIVV